VSAFTCVKFLAHAQTAKFFKPFSHIFLRFTRHASCEILKRLFKKVQIGVLPKLERHMRSNKPFTNTTFTKRVDREAGRHRGARAMREPAICKECGAVYANRRWQTGDVERPEGSQMTVCPACKQASTGEPRGFVYLDGGFFVEHRSEIENLLVNEGKRVAEDNPLARILDFKETGRHKLTVTTTTEHLAQRLGHALEKAFGGEVQYDFSHENKVARVSWQRD
jgi:predicted Zn-ribbon and HTH transcriptional regulator